MLPLSFENQIAERIRRLDTTADFLAGVSGVPGTRLSKAFRGIQPLDNEQGLRLLNVLRELEDLAKQLAPIPVAFKNPNMIRTILQEKKNGNLEINVRTGEKA